MKIKYIGLKDDRFNYIVTLNGHDFNYFAGIGHSYAGVKKEILDIPLKDEEKELVLKQYPRYRNILADKISYRVYLRFPKEADILECLQSDVDAGQMSFYDFCDNFGYDQDSIKALNTHFACMETARKLRGFKFPERDGEE